MPRARDVDALERDLRAVEGDVDLLAFARPQTVDQRGQDGVGQHRAAGLVGDTALDAMRGITIAGVEHHDAADRLGDGVVAGIAAARPVRPEHAGGGEHQAGVDLREHVVADAQLLHRAGAEVLGHGIDLRRDPQHHLPALRSRQIEAEAALVAVERLEVGGVAVHVPAEGAAGIAARLLDLEHIRTQVRQQQRAESPLLEAGEVEDADTIQRTRHGVTP